MAFTLTHIWTVIIYLLNKITQDIKLSPLESDKHGVTQYSLVLECVTTGIQNDVYWIGVIQ